MGKIDISASADWRHWALVLAAGLTVPRATKHNFYLWVLEVQILCATITIARKNTNRVSKIQSPYAAVGARQTAALAESTRDIKDSADRKLAESLRRDFGS